MEGQIDGQTKWDITRDAVDSVLQLWRTGKFWFMIIQGRVVTELRVYRDQ